MKQIISAGFIIFRRNPELRDTQFLLLYHGRGHWSFPKGRLEAGERAVAASFREVEEETGLKRHDLHVVPGFRTTNKFFLSVLPRQDLRQRHQARETAFKIVIYFLAETRKREIALSKEHEGYGWFTAREAVRVIKYEDLRKLIKEAYDFIHKGVRRHPGHPKGPGGNLR